MSKMKDLAIELGEQQIAQEETGLSLELSISQMDWKPLLDKYTKILENKKTKRR